MKEIEYRIRPVTRHVVTRWESESSPNGCCSGGSECLGEFDSYDSAQRVMQALVTAETLPNGIMPEQPTADSVRWEIHNTDTTPS